MGSRRLRRLPERSFECRRGLGTAGWYEGLEVWVRGSTVIWTRLQGRIPLHGVWDIEVVDLHFRASLFTLVVDNEHLSMNIDERESSCCDIRLVRFSKDRNLKVIFQAHRSKSHCIPSLIHTFHLKAMYQLFATAHDLSASMSSTKYYNARCGMPSWSYVNSKLSFIILEKYAFLFQRKFIVDKQF
jgi:hypothetical protein